MVAIRSSHSIGLPAALTLLSCGASEKLPLFADFDNHLLSQSPVVSYQGFYYAERRVEMPPRTEAEVIFFYSDGACYDLVWTGYGDIANIEQHIRNIDSTVDGIQATARYGLGWCLYDSQSDTLVVESLAPVNWKKQAYRTNYIVLADTTLRVLGSYPIWDHRRKRQQNTDAALPSGFVDFHFRKSTWKPDSSLYLRKNTEFLKEQRKYTRAH